VSVRAATGTAKAAATGGNTGGSSGSRIQARLINILTLALTHGLMAYAAWKLMLRDDLDEEGAMTRPGSRWLKKRGNPPTDGEA
jgi:hypothetical protein